MDIMTDMLAEIEFSGEFNLLDYIITNYLGDSTIDDAARLLLLPAAAKIARNRLRSERALIVTSYSSSAGTRRSVWCSEFSLHPANELLVNSCDGKLPLTSYYFERKEIVLQYPQFPALRCGYGAWTRYYALELLDILFY